MTLLTFAAGAAAAPQSGLIEGVATDCDRQPLGGVQVFLNKMPDTLKPGGMTVRPPIQFNDLHVQTATTEDSTGIFKFEQISPGWYQVVLFWGDDETGGLAPCEGMAIDFVRVAADSVAVVSAGSKVLWSTVEHYAHDWAPEYRMLPGTVVDTAKWIIYRDSAHGLSFRYPDYLQVSADSTGLISLRHSIPCVHDDPCYLKDDPIKPLSELTDFSVTVRFVNSETAEIVQPGQLEAFKAGDLLGYRSYQGAEGCGQFTHYLPWTDSTTLVVVRDQITELSPIIVNYQTYRRLPGVIVPEQEEYLFYQILATFKRLQ